jgi:hypothetical protein
MTSPSLSAICCWTAAMLACAGEMILYLIGLRLLAFLDLLRPVLPLGVVVVVERVVVEVAPLLEVALDEAEVQVLLEILDLERLDLRLERRDLLRCVTGVDARLRGGDLLRGFLIGRVGLEPRLLVGDLLLDGVDLEAGEAALPLLPGPTEEVVVGERPETAHEQHERQHQPDRAVGTSSSRGIASCHGSAHALRSRTRPARKKPSPLRPDTVPSMSVAHDAEVEAETDVREAQRLEQLGEEEYVGDATIRC